MDLDVLRRIDSDTDFVLTDSGDHDCDLLTNSNPFFNFST
jgi:hypothetical protein